jgi:hypothetical protein
MSNRPLGPVPTLTLTCLEADECTVYFEPWGTEHLLERDNSFTIATWALASGHIEVSFVPNGIIVGITSNDEINVHDKTGIELAI